jgi:hypothetical protein
MNAQTAAWTQWATAVKLGPRVAALVRNPSAPTLRDHQRWIAEHRYPDTEPIPATPEVRAWARTAGLSLRQEISGTIYHRGVAYWLPSGSTGGTGAPRISATGNITGTR